MDTQKLVCVKPIHLTITGCLNSAYLLGQIIYWDKIYKGAEFYNTDEAFATQLQMGLKAFRLAKAKLKHLGVIFTSLKGIPAKTNYKLNNDVLENLEKTAESSVCQKGINLGDHNGQTCLPQIVQTSLSEKVQTGLPQLEQSTTESTPEINNNKNINLTVNGKKSDIAFQKSISGDLEPESELKIQKSPTRKKTTIPEDLTLSEEWRQGAVAKGLHPDWVDDEFEAFTRTFIEKGSRKSRWDWTWQKWVQNAIGYAPGKTKKKPYNMVKTASPQEEPEINKFLASIKFKPREEKSYGC